MGLQIGSLYVRRSIFIKAPARRVWQEFESFERIREWFGIGHQLHKLEPVVGGEVDLSMPNDYNVNTGDDGRIHMIGNVLEFEPDHEISFRTRWQLEDQIDASLWTLRITPLYEGTSVEIFQHGFEVSGERAADQLQGHEEGWDFKHLKMLRSIVEN